MELIAVVDNNWGIGNNGQLLFCLPNDLKKFKSITVGGVVIMGRKTLESLPNQKPLPYRVNIVLTREPSYVVEGAKVVNSIDEAICVANNIEGDAINVATKIKSIDTIGDNSNTRVFVIGGEEIYRQMLPYCTVAHITKVNSCESADKYMVNLDNDCEWQIMQESEEYVDGDISYKYIEYKRIK